MAITKRPKSLTWQLFHEEPCTSQWSVKLNLLGIITVPSELQELAYTVTVLLGNSYNGEFVVLRRAVSALLDTQKRQIVSPAKCKTISADRATTRRR